jgi:hypothetical protein
MEKKMDRPELVVEIEELETRTAPDGGETVLPLAPGHHH